MLRKLILAGVALLVMAPAAQALPAVGTTPGGELVRYDTDAPGAILERHAITGLQPGEKVMGLDVRPATGQLFALGIVRAANDTGRVYTIDPGTGAATQVGAAPFSTTLTPSDYGFDFNPVVDRIRLINRQDQNMRLNPTDGSLLSPPNGDTPISPTSDDISAIAYDQNVAGTPQTTLFGYDFAHDQVVRIGDVNGFPMGPNGGIATDLANPSGISAGDGGNTGMDITPSGLAFMTSSLMGNPASSLYRVSLQNGVLTPVGVFSETVNDVAVLQPTSFQIAGRFVTVGEDGVNALVEVQRTGNLSGTQTVSYSTADGTATAGPDYEAKSGTVTFAPNDALTGFTVPVTDDTADEPAEKFTASISAPTGGAALGSNSSTEVTILDNDPAPAAPDTVKPQLLLSVPSSLTATTFGRGLAGSFSCSEKCSARFTVKLGKRTIGKGTKALAQAGVGKFKAKLSSSGKKALRKRLKSRRTARVVLNATATDATGNVGKRSAVVTVRR